MPQVRILSLGPVYRLKGEKNLIVEGDLGIYTNIYDTGKIRSGTKTHLYHGTCKICGIEVEKPLYMLRHSKKCRHRKKHIANGYIEIYFPEHHSAKNHGFVYEHIVVAEKILGRNLKEGEVVHHINQKRTDNSPKNLMVFKTKEDHSRFHKTGKAIKNDDGTYYSPIQNICVDCGKEIDYKAIRCINCYKKYKMSHLPSKEILIELLKNNSLFAIGKMYGVSGNAVKKWCKKYDI